MTLTKILNSSTSILNKSCLHCDEDIVVPYFNSDDLQKSHPFCCQGCLTVYNVINQKGLSDYYEIKSNSNLFKRRAPVELRRDQFHYMDSSDFLNEYSYKNSSNLQVMEFYLEGIHCLACLWLVEKLPAFLNDVHTSRLDINKSVATISITHGGKFSCVAQELSNLGYRPHPLKRNEELEIFKKNADRASLIKIGIAGAGAGNIMFYAGSIYSGADGFFLTIFSYLTVILAFPVLLFSAIPFYQSAWNAIKNKSINIDVPIAIALIFGFFHGIINLINSSPVNYFDSLTELVFLLLLTRYFLAKVQEKGLSATDLNFFYQSNSVKKLVEQSYVDTHPKYLKPKDIIKVSATEMIPIDGIILKGNSNINNSLLTGESLPVNVAQNDLVFSGTQNIDAELIIEVINTNQETRLGKILKEVESGWIQKARIVELTNKFSKYFILVIFGLAIGLATLLYLNGKGELAIERALALLIVTCPCALALATPLTLANTLSRASKKGIIIKNDEVIQKLSEINEVFLDKTGTITFGNLKITSIKGIMKSEQEYFDIIYSLEKKSIHPVARALKEYISENHQVSNLDIKNWKEILGVGVQGHFGENFYEIKNSTLFINGEPALTFVINDQIRPDSIKAIHLLNKLKIKSHIISGDNNLIAHEVGNLVGIKSEFIHGNISPETKLTMIEKTEKSIMVGDGANDAMALSKAYVGIAVHGSMDISLRAADVYLTTPGILPLVDLIIISKETMKVIYRNLSISIIYNIISVFAVYLGYINPLVAAIIMPISSITVLISTLIGTKNLNKRLRL